MRKRLLWTLLMLPVVAFGRVVNVDYYGKEVKVHFADTKMVKVKKDKDSKIKKCITWLEVATYETLKDCQEAKRDMALCDWAYVKLLDKVSEKVLGNGNEAVIMMAVLMDRSGFDVRLAGDGAKKVALLFRSDALSIGTYKSVDVDGKRYFVYGDLAKEPQVKDMSRHQGQAVSLKMERELDIKGFYADIPQFNYSDGTNRERMLLALPVAEAMVKDMKSQVDGMKQMNAIKQLQNTVNFYYEEDQRPTMLYRLVRDVLGLQVESVLHQGQQVVGVCVTDDDNVEGDYVVKDGMHYVIIK